jgi:N-methylhydantoinase A/oxoprolinase/acetone carboxylase beta subunit
MKDRNCICVIGCGVLAIDIKKIAEELDLDVEYEFLSGGLHEKPGHLRQQLQEAIDRASEKNRFKKIAIGYGICGQGTVGIKARNIPIVLPKVHDCIALFLGSDRAYREQFHKYPGTYYISAGWFNEKVEPFSQKKGPGLDWEDHPEFQKLVIKYGMDNARAVAEFFNSWKRNYHRAVFINTGMGQKKKYAEYTRSMAEKFQWKYEEITGSTSLLEKILTSTKSSDEILIVPPEHGTVFDALSGKLKAAAPWQSKSNSWKPHNNTITVVKDKNQSVSRDIIRQGLGIDAGGTYTDAVIFSFENDIVIDKAKAPTTPWDFTIGIKEALDTLDKNLLKDTELVSVSTTLATNALVEGYGQKVGLLVMPPAGLFNPSDIPHTPAVPISGSINIKGKITAPINHSEILHVVREMIAKNQVKAFAVSGYAGTINPEHELQAKRIIREETGLSVTCGHELSELLNYLTRAMTAVLNAKIIPRLGKFLDEIELTLRNHDIIGPIVVVKGDGSLMSVETAKDRPVETILSGPAASVAGARHLTGRDDALVVDIGGTTTDTAELTQGTVRTSKKGATVGNFHTHVQALDMRTTGLGGDSLLTISESKLQIGPKRVFPVSWLGAENINVSKTLDHLEKRLDFIRKYPDKLQIVTTTGRNHLPDITPDEKTVLKSLKERPRSLDELNDVVTITPWTLKRFEEHDMVKMSSLTPTDLLHITGEYNRWDRNSAVRMSCLLGELLGLDQKNFIDHVHEQIIHRLSMELLKKLLGDEILPDTMDDCYVCQTLFTNWLTPGKEGLNVVFSFSHPLIGIGAPVHHFLPGAAKYLNAECIIPPDADVANAIGAITSEIMVCRHVRVKPDQEGGFTIEGLSGAKTFDDFDDANAYAVNALVEKVQRIGVHAGASRGRVEIHAEDKTVHTSYGDELFLGRTITARFRGRPDLSRLTDVQEPEETPIHK